MAHLYRAAVGLEGEALEVLPFSLHQRRQLREHHGWQRGARLYFADSQGEGAVGGGGSMDQLPAPPLAGRALSCNDLSGWDEPHAQAPLAPAAAFGDHAAQYQRTLPVRAHSMTRPLLHWSALTGRLRAATPAGKAHAPGASGLTTEAASHQHGWSAYATITPTIARVCPVVVTALANSRQYQPMHQRGRRTPAYGAADRPLDTR